MTSLKDCPACAETKGVIVHTGLEKVHCIACGWEGEPIREDARTGETFDSKEWLNEK
jgi:Zn ribbon nucleic-acid-binding protein